MARIYDGTTLVKTHALQPGERNYVDHADYPEQKVAFLQRTPSWCRRRAVELGPAVQALVDDLLAGPHPLACLRQAQGILRLADTHEPGRLNAACQRALVADGSLRTVRNILARDQQRRRGRADRQHRRRLPPRRAAAARGDTVVRPAELQAKLKTLKLGGMLLTLEMRRAQAEDQRLGHVEFLALLLDDEIDRRQSKMLAQRLHRARFEEPKTLEEFDFSFNPQIPAEQLRNLATCGFVERHEVGAALWAGRGRQDPRGAGVGARRLPCRVHRALHQDLGLPARPGRRPGRRQLGASAAPLPAE